MRSDYIQETKHDVIMEEHPAVQLKKDLPFFSAHTTSYFKTLIVLIIILSALFTAEQFQVFPQILDQISGLSLEKMNFYLPLLLLTATSFIFFLLAFVSDLTRDTKPENLFVYWVTYLLILLLLPLYLMYLPFKFLRKHQENVPQDVAKNKPLTTLIKVSAALLIVVFSFSFFLREWRVAANQSTIVVGQRLGIVPEPIPIAGTGSMYPTFPKGEEKDPQLQAQELVATAGMLPFPSGFSILGFEYGSSTINRKDIVSFSNTKTEEITQKKYGHSSGLVKRVIGLPGDKIELRSGILYLNGEPQKEPYVAKARSTFGGDTLPECEEVTVPDGSLFVLGDNRTASNDSRHDVGFIKIEDVDHLLPFEKQLGVVDALWHNPENDLSENAKISINRTEILRLINEERKRQGADPLKYNAKLDNSAKLRGAKMLQFDDFSTEAQKSGYPLTRALNDAGYSNVVYGEFYVQGYFEADELIENLKEFPKTVEFLGKKDYQEIGFSEVEGDLNGCPSQVIVFHLGGYMPPDYSAEDIEGWQKSLENLKGIQPSWAELKNSGRFYEENKAEVDRINDLIASSISVLESIVKQMQSNQWLTAEQRAFADRQEAVYEEIDQLTRSLNEKSKSF